MSRRESGGSFRRLLILVVLAGAVFGGLATFRAGPAPLIEIDSELPGIGKRTKIFVRVAEPKRGLSDLRVEFVQGENVQQLMARTYTPRPPWAYWGERTAEDELSVVAGSENIEGLVEGPAMIRVVAERAGTWLRSPDPAIAEMEIEVKLRPPSLQVLSSFTYVKQGGAEAVVYTVDDTSVIDGVQAGKWWFPGHPVPGQPAQKFALFSAPYDLDDANQIRLVARDAVGNEAQASFIDQFSRRPYKTGRIQLSEEFMARVVPAILAQTPEIRDKGNLLDNYLHINGELRKQNSQVLIDLASDSSSQFFWSRPFAQMRNAQVMSDFAARRTYIHEGEPVDEQDHLGLDLASTRQAEIQASNAGVVKLARYFGIYGNAVVIDHGFGLMSLYGHLSSIGVAEGQRVERGDAIGRSGATGLAGGDHLHFTMLLQGLPVDPREWWDSHWIHDRLVLKLGAALPFEG